MFPNSIHIHKNRLYNSHNIILFLIPVFAFVLLVSLAYSILLNSGLITFSKSLNSNSYIAGDAAFDSTIWEYRGPE